MSSLHPKRALVVRGGWDGHSPVQATDMFIPHLEANGYSVRVEGSPAPYADADYMAGVDLVMQCNTMASIEEHELAGLRAAIAAGPAWLAGMGVSPTHTVVRRTTCS